VNWLSLYHTELPQSIKRNEGTEKIEAIKAKHANYAERH
jgi:hypothetical protein